MAKCSQIKQTFPPCPSSYSTTPQTTNPTKKQPTPTSVKMLGKKVYKVRKPGWEEAELPHWSVSTPFYPQYRAPTDPHVVFFICIYLDLLWCQESSIANSNRCYFFHTYRWKVWNDFNFRHRLEIRKQIQEWYSYLKIKNTWFCLEATQHI